MPRSRLNPDAPWTPPESWRRIRTIDAHAGGEPFRVVVEGVPDIPGPTMLDKRRFATDRLDELRRRLMWEPRGHADMYGCVLTDPVSAGADFGILFMHNEGFSTMCGHGIIAVTTVVLEAGLLPRVEPEPLVVRIDTPAGPVRATASVTGGAVSDVSFENVISFVSALDAEVDVPGYGAVRYDLAFGGAFYAYLDARALGLELDTAHAGAVIEAGRAIKRAIVGSRPIVHPDANDLGFLYGVIFIGPPEDSAHHSRNVCVFADGEVDRSPTGTGVSGRVALHHARGEIAIGESIVIESIVGSTFEARVARAVEGGIVPEVRGRAHITGRHEFWIDPSDELPSFLVR